MINKSLTEQNIIKCNDGTNVNNISNTNNGSNANNVTVETPN